MEDFFFGDGTAWDSAPPPSGVRPVVLDLLHALVRVQVCMAGGQGASATSCLGSMHFLGGRMGKCKLARGVSGAGFIGWVGCVG